MLKMEIGREYLYFSRVSLSKCLTADTAALSLCLENTRFTVNQDILLQLKYILEKGTAALLGKIGILLIKFGQT